MDFEALHVAFNHHSHYVFWYLSLPISPIRHLDNNKQNQMKLPKCFVKAKQNNNNKKNPEQINFDKYQLHLIPVYLKLKKKKKIKCQVL